MNNVKSIFMPPNLAKLLYSCSTQDTTRGILFRTFHIDQEGDEFVIAATDTHRLAVVRMDAGTHAAMGLPESGTWRWVTYRPTPTSRNLIIQELADGEWGGGKDYPNWRRVMSTEKYKSEGAIICDLSRSWGVRIATTASINLNMNLLPSYPALWIGEVLVDPQGYSKYLFHADDVQEEYKNWLGAKYTVKFNLEYLQMGMASLDIPQREAKS